MLKIAFLIAATFGAVYGQERRCEAPSYFESRMLRYDTKNNYYRFGTYFYDKDGERGRVIEKTAINQTRPAYDVLTLHKERKQFTVDLMTGKCTESIPDHEFSPIAISPEDQFINDFIVGSFPGDGVELTLWGRTVNDTNHQGHWLQEYTKKDCIPVYVSFFGKVNGTSYDYRLEYFDVITQMSNTNIFDIPKECLKGD